MTMPTLINNYQKKVTVNRLKQTYSILYQAIRLSEADNGEISEWTMGDETYASSEAFANKYLIPYLQVKKICNNSKNACNVSNNYYLNGSAASSSNNTYIFALKNGSVIYVWARNTITEVGVWINPAKKILVGKIYFI